MTGEAEGGQGMHMRACRGKRCIGDTAAHDSTDGGPSCLAVANAAMEGEPMQGALRHQQGAWHGECAKQQAASAPLIRHSCVGSGFCSSDSPAIASGE